ncbi:MAG: hypothetical protein AMJ62_00995 [Myxococcales bacterium SG8_38]|nr:MAG: hypothetical protein AMJ62_00995 [Myxococcales bacterium SG8_38]
MRLAALALLLLAAVLGGAFAAPLASPVGNPKALAVETDGTGRGDPEFVRGVALGLFATDRRWDYGPLVDEIRARGATDVLVVVNAYQSNRFSSDIALEAGRSPSNATVARTLRQVKKAGMRAALMPVVRLSERAPHEWRGLIAPADGLDAWFEAYRRFVLPLAHLAGEAGVERFIAGSELSSLERYEDHWRELFAELRDAFSGTLTYSANWDHADAVPFWDALDEVGLTAYFPLITEEGEPKPASADTLAGAWQTPRATIEALAKRVGKPVLITEIGYASRSLAAGRPWDDATEAAVDLGLQQALYRGFCDAFAQTPSIGGFYVWNWFGVGGPRDRGFTPRGKPAASELAKCFARPWPAPADAGNRS